MQAANSAGTFEVEVPGKIMLAGEYAVLKGARSLSAAVDAYLHLEIEPSENEGVWVESNLWPEPKLLTPAPHNEPLLDSLQKLGSHNARVRVRSELDLSFGLGSSSAVRLAAHLGVQAFARKNPQLSYDDRQDAAREAWHRQRAEQGFASGYDLVTQLHGGLVLWQPDYENWPGSLRSHYPAWLSDFVHPYVGGKGAPTASVGGGVKAYLESEGLWPRLIAESEALIDAFWDFSPEKIFHAVSAHRALFEKAPFYPENLRNLLASLRDFDRSWSFKTTGAGGEDAILLLGPRSSLGEADEALRRAGWRPLPHAFTERGARVIAREWEA